MCRCEELRGEECGSCLKECEGYFRDYLKGVAGKPPLRLVVVATSIEDAGRRVGKEAGGLVGGDRARLYGIAFHVAFTKQVAERLDDLVEVEVEPGAQASKDVYEFTKKLYESRYTRLRPRYCTVCGQLPAVISVPRRGRGYRSLLRS
jgi:hypothetical protein